MSSAGYNTDVYVRQDALPVLLNGRLRVRRVQGVEYVAQLRELDVRGEDLHATQRDTLK